MTIASGSFGLAEPSQNGTATIEAPQTEGQKIIPQSKISPIPMDGMSEVLTSKTPKELEAEKKAAESKDPVKTEVVGIEKKEESIAKETPPDSGVSIEEDQKDHELIEKIQNEFIESQKEKKSTEFEKTVISDTQTTPQTKKEESDKIISHYNAIMSNPVAKSVIDAVMAGEDLVSLVKKVEGIDVASMKGEDLIREQCKREGVTDEADIEVEIDAFNSKSPLEKKKKENEIKAELKKDQDSRLIQFSNQSAKTLQKTVEDQNKIHTKLQSDLSNLISEKVDKEYYGIKATPELLQAAKKVADNFLGIFNEDGSVNAKELFRASFLAANVSEMQKHYIATFTKKGILSERVLHTRPDKMITTSKPLEVTKKDTEELPSWNPKVEPIEVKRK